MLGSLAALVFRLRGPDLAPTLDETLQVPGLAPAAAAHARTAFVTGLHVAAAVASVLHIVLGLVALRWLSPAPARPGSRPATARTEVI